MSTKKSPRWLKGVFLLMFLLGVTVCGGWFYHQSYTEGVVQYQTSPVVRGELLQIVTASGQLNPVTMVDVGSQISGIIQQLFVDFNSTVTQRQVIALIDPSTYQANALQGEGNLANARAALELAQIEERRAQKLRKDNLNTQAEYDSALAALHQAEANVKIKEGALKSAQVDLARCTIYSPIDGLVLSRNVNVGQTVAASLSAPTLFVIANDLTKMQIEANIAEADIGLVAVGQTAEFAVDAYPGQAFHGKVKQIRNAPKTEQNVVTYATIIEVSNPDVKLKPGMTANVSVIIARHEDTLKLANAAFRFHPPDFPATKMGERQPKASSPGKRDQDGLARGEKKHQRKVERVVYVASLTKPGDRTSPTGSLQPVTIKSGINNAAFTEVLDGLKEGDEVVVGLGSAKARKAPTLNPFASTSRH
ncbi:MAG TPA: efflux RND transporter periplasmic adaptor subunit [Candidatus Limnocylindrales bacterium]|nr:efflux RND transporter periplasmic adaptor subunit [Candidatus Limnocylindrales bacterium]